ncbi:hypothetical protein BS78_10G061900 [Paspalum vaginatum]|nr:hypothetical protein BS78_10G061900 [Paspalum vaginatum]
MPLLAYTKHFWTKLPLWLSSSSSSSPVVFAGARRGHGSSESLLTRVARRGGAWPQVGRRGTANAAWLEAGWSGATQHGRSRLTGRARRSMCSWTGLATAAAAGDDYAPLARAARTQQRSLASAARTQQRRTRPRDEFHIMSNEIFKGPMHRAVTNSEKERISLTMFYAADLEKEIELIA